MLIISDMSEPKKRKVTSIQNEIESLETNIRSVENRIKSKKDEVLSLQSKVIIEEKYAELLRDELKNLKILEKISERLNDK